MVLPILMSLYVNVSSVNMTYKLMTIQALSSLLEMTKGEEPRCGIPMLCQLKSTVF